MEELNSKTRFNTKPEIDGALLGMNEERLIIQTLLIRYKLFVLLPIYITFFLVALLLLLCLTPDFLLSISNGQFKTPNSFYGLRYFTFITILSMTLAIYCFIIYLKYVVTKSLSPITFNRKTQTVSTILKRKKTVIPWDKFTCNQVLIPPIVSRIDTELGAISGNEDTWEYICTFMEEGPEKLRIKPYISDTWYNLPLYSRSFKHAIETHNPFRIREVETSFYHWVALPFRLPLFIPALLVEWFWRRMMLKSFKNSINFPSHRVKNWKIPLVTGHMATQATNGSERYYGIRYSEIKNRFDNGMYSYDDREKLEDFKNL